MPNNQQQPHQLTHLVSIPEEDASSCSSSTSVFKDSNDAENQQLPLQQHNNRIKQAVDKIAAPLLPKTKKNSFPSIFTMVVRQDVTRKGQQ
uniref:Uncharacterized protein n=1 Tax=Ditylenchus dipsaci TaxID=166011 RepID=A0A915D5S1_9BILA